MRSSNSSTFKCLACRVTLPNNACLRCFVERIRDVCHANMRLQLSVLEGGCRKLLPHTMNPCSPVWQWNLQPATTTATNSCMQYRQDSYYTYAPPDAASSLPLPVPSRIGAPCSWKGSSARGEFRGNGVSSLHDRDFDFSLYVPVNSDIKTNVNHTRGKLPMI